MGKIKNETLRKRPTAPLIFKKIKDKSPFEISGKEVILKFNPDIKFAIEQLRSFGKINKLPLDLKTYCKNNSILEGKQDIWSLSWTLFHYFDDALVLYPPISLIKNIGFDGTGIHCTKTNVFNVKNSLKTTKISYQKNIKVHLLKKT